MKKLAMLFLLFVAVAHADTLPDAPKPKLNQKVFWTGTVLLAGAKSADMISTRHALDVGRWESDPVFGNRPSNRRLVAVSASIFAAEESAFFFTERQRSPWLRWAGRALISFSVYQHVRLATCNAKISAKTLYSSACHTF